MPVTEVTFYEVHCDCCDEAADFGDYAALPNREDAESEAISYADFRLIDDELLCEDCWCDPQDLEGYIDGVHDAEVMRRHASHDDEDIMLRCPSTCPETGEACIETGLHAVHTASPTDGPDWGDEE